MCVRAAADAGVRTGIQHWNRQNKDRMFLCSAGGGGGGGGGGGCRGGGAGGGGRVGGVWRMYYRRRIAQPSRAGTYVGERAERRLQRPR